MEESPIVYLDYIPRPQLRFKDIIDNSERPWKPRIKCKPNAIEPLDLFLEKKEDGTLAYCHPYDHELDQFIVPQIQLEKIPTIKCKSLSETSLVLIENNDSLESMMEDLMKQKEMAISMKNHSERSYQGFICLLQISTRDKDYVIDAIKLRAELKILNEAFTKSSILKVFYNAEVDLLRLQRDFSVYVVNMFDIVTAAEVCSKYTYLSYLIKKYLSIDQTNAYLSGDWRLRPLPSNFIENARENVHFLLGLKDALSNELLDCNELENVYKKCKCICKKTYEKPKWTKESHHIIYNRFCDKMFNDKQFFSLAILNRMRFEIAKYLDENPSYILPDELMLKVAETAPIEKCEVYDIKKHFFSSELIKWYVDRANCIMTKEEEKRRVTDQGSNFPLAYSEMYKSQTATKKCKIIKIILSFIIICFGVFYLMWISNKI